MKIFVAGATGVLGRRVVPQLVADGHDVTAVARGAVKAAALRGQGAAPVTVDLFDAAAVTAAVADHEAVVNLATAIPSTMQMARTAAWDVTSRLRTEGARNLVDAALATGAARYVQEALGFVYADHGAAWIDEDATLHPPKYAAAVEAAEAHTRRFDAGPGTGVVLRFGLFYSADSSQTRDMAGMIRRGLMPMPGRDAGYQPWVHVDDAAAAVVAALAAPGGAYNAVEDEPLTNAAQADVLGAVVGRRVRRPPAWLAMGPMVLGTRSQRVSNRRLRAATGWRPAFPSRRTGWPAVLAAVATTPEAAAA